MTTVFVFGSNLAGRHGKGAALHARINYGAELGIGRGRTGNSYALPTKDEKLNILPIEFIRHEIEQFIGYARTQKDDLFILTPVGCGLAGYKRKDIWAILQRLGLPPNVVLAHTWVDH